MGVQMGSVVTVGLPPLGYTLDGDVKVFILIAQPVLSVITNGVPSYWEVIPEENRYTGPAMPYYPQRVKAWGFNGITPGPTIEVTEGDRVRVIVKNELPEPTSVHWHGILVPNAEDGAGGVTQPVIAPGKSWTYEFTLYQTGTYMYHSGFNPAKQEGMGMAGFFIVHPKDPPDKIDRDYAIMLQEWAILPGNETINAMSMAPNWFTFNGKAAPSIPILEAKQGERVRVRFGNLSMNSHPIHIHGYTWTVVGTEGGPIQKSAQWPGATINVSPGETRDVEFVAWNPGVWRLHCHKLHHMMNMNHDMPMGIMQPGGMYTYVYVTPQDPEAPWTPPTTEETY